MKLMLQLQRPPFWIYIYLFLTGLFPPTFMVNGLTLSLILQIFPFSDGNVPRRPSYEVYIFQLIRVAIKIFVFVYANCRFSDDADYTTLG